MLRAFAAASLLCMAGVHLSAQEYPIVREVHPFAGSRLFVPNNQEPRTSVIMLHGSEGGSVPYIESEATVLATQGFAVLVLCYFDCLRGLVGPRQTLKDVDVSTVTNAIGWMRSQPLSNGRVVVYGFSRGGELAMVIGSLSLPEAEKADALIAHSPSDKFNSFYNWSWREPSCWLCRRGQGQCPDPNRRADFQWNLSCGPDDETRMDFSRSAWLIAGRFVATGMRIEIEKFEGPVLITVGEKDQTWPVDQTRRLEASLRAVGRDPEVHYFPEGGHVFAAGDENKRRGIVLAFLRRIHDPVSRSPLPQSH
ncbi:MAG: dienelactone hydrolase family protein [Bryobacterales bacterium]|nr:dienelactone hydrolase family protein [Bryobacterales bacterium]